MRDYRLTKTDTNVVKGVAICAMLWHHLFYKCPEYGTLVCQLGQAGKVCVSIFLFLSGYGLALKYSYLSPANWREKLNFLIKRLVKFYSNYWVVFLVSVLVGVFVFDRSLDTVYGTHVFRRLCLDFCGVLGYKSYNVTWWFNCLIIACYLLFPFLFSVLSKRKLSVLAVIGLLLLPKCADKQFFYSEVICGYLFHFGLGIYIANNSETISKILNKINNKWIVLISAITIVILVLERQLRLVSFFGGMRVDIFITFTLTLLVKSLNIIKGNANCWVENMFSFLGRHSMNMYLIHTFIHFYFGREFIYGFRHPLLIFCSLLAFSLLISLILEFAKNKSGYSNMVNKIISALN